MAKTSKSAKEIVVERLLEQIENDNVLPWKKSWKIVPSKGKFIPYNYVTGKEYRGINILMLWMLGGKYEVPAYMTYNQAKALGGNVKKGESGFPVLFAQVKEFPALDENNQQIVDKDGNIKTNKVWMNRYYTVFNVEQIEGLPEIKVDETVVPQTQEERNEIADKIIQNTGAVVEYGEPAYYPAKDIIYCPDLSDFDTDANYYATIFHELVHWTGAEHRLHREIKNSFGNEKYSKEELVAEIGASFMMAHLGIWNETVESNAAYVKSWLKVLKDDTSLIIKCASLAQKAMDYIMNCENTVPLLTTESTKTEITA